MQKVLPLFTLIVLTFGFSGYSQQNPGFENWNGENLIGWESSNSLILFFAPKTVSVCPPHSGNFGLKIENARWSDHGQLDAKDRRQRFRNHADT